MRITENCAECLYDKQRRLTDDTEYLAEVKRIIDDRNADDTAPILIYRFAKAYEKRFGKSASYKEVKKRYNDLVLSVQTDLRLKIEQSDDSLKTALAYSRIGNYIDFGAMNSVDEDAFFSLLEGAAILERDRRSVDSFLTALPQAGKFLLIADNCGEIVLDKLFIEQLLKRYPNAKITVMVRGGEVLNDATLEDARYVGIDKYAELISNGAPIAGTVYSMLPDGAKNALDTADVILAKGQGNYESLCNQGRHIFYSFLCKCELFTDRFNVPKFTGIFVEES